ncbi:MAG: helix-hairpin-helix domain-containing protein [Gaiellaceae bacterium]
MALTNAFIAGRLEAFAALLELAGAGPYSAWAYRRAAELVRATPAPVAELVRAGRARELRGIGRGIEARLRELVETGEIAELAELERTVSPELVGLGRYLGLGPQRAVELGRALDVRTATELHQAATDGRLREVPGIGPKTEARIVAALAESRPEPRRAVLLHRARALTEAVAEALGGEPAGDARRWRDRCERLAAVVPAARPATVLARFEALPQIVAVVERGTRRALGVTVDGIPLELHVPPPGAYGTALVRATGSAEWVAGHEPLPAAAREEDVLQPWVPPELRELGAPSVKSLVEPAEIRGDLHVHTTWSDGRASVLEMGLAARARGYDYLAICDHTPNVRVVPGLDADALRRQGEEIAAANADLAPFRLLRGTECDIRADGSLDLPDDILDELDWVQLSLHAGQRAPRGELTRKVTEAMRHPAVRCLSHPKGRIIDHRPENALDLERVFEVALETGVALEVNGLPDRLDLRGEHVRDAVSAGVTIVCSTDAHGAERLDYMELAVHTARRGGASAADVLNTQPLETVLEKSHFRHT